MKKVIMILIDALMPEALENSIKTGKAKALKFLMENGYYDSKLVTAFPTMTASVDSSLMTGTYPEQHKVPGLIWYHPEEERIIDYVNGFKTTLALGLRNTAKDVLIQLNERHLSKKTKTIYEELQDQNRTAGVINFIIHRGNNQYQLKPPFLFNLVTKYKMNRLAISGPDQFALGAFRKPSLPGRSFRWNFNQCFIKKFGINDQYAIEAAQYIIDTGNQPDFLMIYLPDHDHYLHKNINQPLPSIERVDKKLAKLLDSFGTWETALEQNTFIIIGDHGQTKIGKEKKYNIDLDLLLNSYHVTEIGKKVSKEDEIIFGNNERMAYVYPLAKELERHIQSTLLSESRIDFVAWKKNDGVFVENREGLKLFFKKDGSYTDPYGRKWHIEGDLDLLDIALQKDDIRFGVYPDAFSRLFGALYAQSIPVIVITAKPSYEFISKTFPQHLGGGSHGSLHYTDSIVPLLVAGAEILPKNPIRMVDLKNYVLQLLNVTSTVKG